MRRDIGNTFRSLDYAWWDAVGMGCPDIAERIWPIREEARKLSVELEPKAHSDVEDSIHRLVEYYKDTLNELSKED